MPTRPALSCTILAHPDRQGRAISLAARLLSLHPSVMIDRTVTPGNLDAACLAWAQADGEYHLLVQDDALPSAGFVPSARAACTVAGGAAVAFWMRPWHRDAQRVEQSPPGSLVPIGYRDWPPTVALALPREHALGASAHGVECHADSWYDDEAVGCYLETVGVRLLACAPSIVSHDARVVSLFPVGHDRHRYQRRVQELTVAVKAPREWRIT